MPTRAKARALASASAPAPAPASTSAPAPAPAPTSSPAKPPPSAPGTPMLAYRVLPTALLAFLAYATIILALFLTDILPDAPGPAGQGGLDLGRALEDLQHIAAIPHPYISHANDAVRAYILARVRSLSEKYPHVHVDDDRTSSAAWASPGFGVYFEGMNVLVRVDGVGDVGSGSDAAFGTWGGNGNGNATKNATKNTGPGQGAGAVLFSAHFDSVSTAPGATDDGAGVATLLQLIEYFAVHRTRRTAVFNVNDGEEDGLHGAHAFLQHPWSKETDTFLNLEGAAAGGRPILFRATSITPVRAFHRAFRSANKNKHKNLIPHPHANVLSSDAFARGLIRSWTDFSVYSGANRVSPPSASTQQMESAHAYKRKGMQGLDVAFYKGRSRYHSKYDAMPHTVGGVRSLWSMMEVARGVGVGLLDADGPVGLGDGRVEVQAVDIDEDPVYFDLFKKAIIIFRLKTLLNINLVLLVGAPVVLVLLFLYGRGSDTRSGTGDSNLHSSNSANLGNGTGTGTGTGNDTGRASGARPARRGLAAHLNLRVIWNHVKFWAALVLAAGSAVLLMCGYAFVNAFAIYSSPYLVLFAFMSLAYLVIVHTLSFPSLVFASEVSVFSRTAAGKRRASSSSSYSSPPTSNVPRITHNDNEHEHAQKQTTLTHLYILTWLFLVLATLGITKLDPGVGGGYLVTVWNACVGFALGLGAAERAGWGVGTGFGFGTVGGFGTLEEGWKKMLRLKGTGRGRRGAEQDREEQEQEEEEELPREGDIPRRVEDADEATPLLAHEDERPDGRAQTKVEGAANWWWIPQFVVSVPLPVILWGHVTMLLLDAVPQTMTDGATPWSVYSLVLILALILVIPLAPFADKLRPSRAMTLLVLGIFVLSMTYTLVAFPFSVDAPLKVFFQQRVEFPAGAAAARYGVPGAAQTPRVVTSIAGPPQYIREAVISSLPSARGREVVCKEEKSKLGLLRCEWEAGPRMWPVPGSYVRESDDGRRAWTRDTLLEAEVVRSGPAAALVKMRGRNTRSCRVYFDSRPVYGYNVWPASNRSRAGYAGDDGDGQGQRKKRKRNPGQAAFIVDANNATTYANANMAANTDFGKTELQEGYEIRPDGIRELRLWSRTWEREFRVEVDWRDETPIGTPGMHGRFACVWAQYESGMVDNGALYDPVAGGTDIGAGAEMKMKRARVEEDRPKIPAFEEVLAFLPEWATVSKLTDGLVEATIPFVV